MIKSLYLKVTNRCNLRCRHCYISDYSGDMDLKTVAAVAVRYPTANIIFHGGEPTLAGYDYLSKAAEFLGCRKYILQSNLFHLPVEIIRFVKEVCDERIGTSFDDSRLSFYKKWIENVAVLSEHGINVTAVITLTPSMSQGILAQAIKDFENAGGKAFRLQCETPIRNSILPDASYYELFMEFFAHPLNETAQRVRSAISACSISGVNGGNCARKLRTIDPDGSVYVCPDFAGQKIFRIGNVHDQAQESGRGLDIFNERERRYSLQCCDQYWHICRAGCLASSYFASGDHLGADPYCEIYKRIFSTAKNTVEEGRLVPAR